MVQLLLENGADPYAKTARYENKLVKLSLRYYLYYISPTISFLYNKNVRSKHKNLLGKYFGLSLLSKP